MSQSRAAIGDMLVWDWGSTVLLFLSYRLRALLASAFCRIRSSCPPFLTVVSS